MESTWTKRLYVSAPQTSAHRAPLPRRLGKGRAVRVPDLWGSAVPLGDAECTVLAPPGDVEWHSQAMYSAVQESSKRWATPDGSRTAAGRPRTFGLLVEGNQQYSTGRIVRAVMQGAELLR